MSTTPSFNLKPTVITTTEVDNKPFFFNTDIGGAKVFPEDLCEESLAFVKALVSGKISKDDIEVVFRSVNWFHKNQDEELCDELSGLNKGGLIQLDKKEKNPRYEAIGEVYVDLFSDEWFENDDDHISLTIQIKKRSKNKLLNLITTYKEDDVLTVTSIEHGEKKKKGFKKAIPV